MTEALSDDQYLVVDSPHEIARWRPLVNWILYIPHYIIQGALRALLFIAAVFYWFIRLFTGRLHRGLYDVMTMYERYQVRADSFLVGFSETYAPIELSQGAEDDAAYEPVRLTLPEPSDEVSRAGLFNWFLAIPHYVVFAFYAVAAIVVATLGWCAVLFTGRWPAGMRAFLVRVSNQYFKVWVYVTMVKPGYPSFGLPAR